MKRVLLAVAFLSAACVRASPLPDLPRGDPAPSIAEQVVSATVAKVADRYAPAASASVRQALPAAQRGLLSVPVAIAAESIASAPSVALAAAGGGPIAGAWAWVTSNPTAVGGAAVGLVGLVFFLFGARLRLRPEHAAILAEYGPPLIEQARKATAGTSTPWDDQAVKVVDEIAKKLIAAGAPKPAALNAAKQLVAKAA